MHTNRRRLTVALLSALGCTAVLGAGAVIAGAAPAWADNGPHLATQGNVTIARCAGCHRSQNASAEDLVNTDVSALCATCHSSGVGALTDPWAGWSYPDFVTSLDMTGLRGGGFTSAAIDTTHATLSPDRMIPSLLNTNQPVTSAHSIDGSPQTAWGGGQAGLGTQVSLTCISCHDPHGNGNYRVLRPLVAGGSGADVVIPDATRKTYITTNYWDTQDPYAPGFIEGIANWCSQCHTRHLSDGAGVDSGDAVFTFRHKSSSTSAGGPNCIQCHLAHGTNATMNGTYSGKVPLPSGAAAPSGDSRLLRLDNRGTCTMCHAE